MPKSRRQIIAAYVPVLHKGYLKFFRSYPEADTLYLFGSDLLTKEDYLRKDLRALESKEAKKLIEGLDMFGAVNNLSAKDIKSIDSAALEIIMPDDDISHKVAGLFKKSKISFYPVFLRWDRRSIEGTNQDNTNATISESDFDKKVMQGAMKVAEQSSDIWRRVGAVLIMTDKSVKSAANKGEPTEYSPWMEGDPRNVFNKGIAIEMSVFMHAEANLIAEAARRGVSLDKAKLYVSTYPCPACAKLIAHSGIKTLYYAEGYAVLDGERVMKDYGVKIVKVNVQLPDDRSPVWVPYKK